MTIKSLISLIVTVSTIPCTMLHGQQKEEIQSALTCKECHKEIYSQWSASRHARSTPEMNILFANVYELSQKDTQGQTKLYCIRCHAPVSQISGDTNMEKDITNEGITCDICHTLVELTDHPDKWPNVYNPGIVKQGTHERVDSGEHEVVYSGLFENSRLCLGCHGDMLDIPGTRSCGNLTICDTEFEWKNTTFANEGKSCVDCHMTVDEQNENDREAVERRHDFKGAYSPGMLKEAVNLVLNVKEFEGEVIAKVDIINHATGHLLPTGPPARLIFLKVIALNENSEVIWSNFQDNPVKEDPYGVFHIVFAGLNGKVPSMPWLATKIVKDTRLKPGETRQLVYKFPSKNVSQINAKLFYRLAPLPLLNTFKITDENLRTSYLMSNADKTLK